MVNKSSGRKQAPKPTSPSHVGAEKSPVAKELDKEHAGNKQAEKVFVQLFSAVEVLDQD